MLPPDPFEGLNSDGVKVSTVRSGNWSKQSSIIKVFQSLGVTPTDGQPAKVSYCGESYATGRGGGYYYLAGFVRASPVLDIRASWETE